ncbi:MAG: hypothetical protein OHK0029_02490 [Armatimonadaceae bacterium]
MLKRLLALSVCFFGVAAVAQTPPYTDAVKIAELAAPFIDEASGMADSRTNPGILWIHNDSGDGAYVYGIDRKGATRAVYLVRSAAASDWEAMSQGPGPDGKGSFLYLGDIGDNARSRTDATVYRVPEPTISESSSSKEKPLLTDEPTIRRTFQYPDGAHDAEALMAHPQTGDLYIVTKEPSGAAGVYKFPKEPQAWWEKNTLTRVGTITITGEKHPFPNLVTGGDISPDGKKVILRTYASAYEMQLPQNAKEFDAIWAVRPVAIPLPPMQQGESIAYSTDGKSILTTSEKTPAPLYEMKSK